MPNLSTFETRTSEYYDAETLGVLWLTTPEAVKQMLPPPLEPMAVPLVLGFVANFPRTSFDTPYKMGGIFLFCTCKGEIGTYVLAAPENDDYPVFHGREVLGYPKKMAHLELHRDGQKMRGLIERRGVRLFEVHADLNGQLNSPKAVEIFAALSGPPPAEGEAPYTDGVNFLFKFAHAVEVGRLFEHPPRIVRQVTRQWTRTMELGTAEVKFGSSPFDSPWSKVPVAEMLGAFRTVSDNTMMPPTVVGEVEDEAAFLPYSFVKYEW